MTIEKDETREEKNSLPSFEQHNNILDDDEDAFEETTMHSDATAAIASHELGTSGAESPTESAANDLVSEAAAAISSRASLSSNDPAAHTSQKESISDTARLDHQSEDKSLQLNSPSPSSFPDSQDGQTDTVERQRRQAATTESDSTRPTSFNPPLDDDDALRIRETLPGAVAVPGPNFRSTQTPNDTDDETATTSPEAPATLVAMEPAVTPVLLTAELVDESATERQVLAMQERLVVLERELESARQQQQQLAPTNASLVQDESGAPAVESIVLAEPPDTTFEISSVPRQEQAALASGESHLAHVAVSVPDDPLPSDEESLASETPKKSSWGFTIFIIVLTLVAIGAGVGIDQASKKQQQEQNSTDTSAPAGPVQFINCGWSVENPNAVYLDETTDRQWVSDRYYQGGVAVRKDETMDNPVRDTARTQSRPDIDLVYEIPVPTTSNDSNWYRVDLFFHDWDPVEEAGDHLMNIHLEEELVLSAYAMFERFHSDDDIATLRDTAVETFETLVTDGFLSIRLAKTNLPSGDGKGTWLARINAIALYRIPPPSEEDRVVSLLESIDLLSTQEFQIADSYQSHALAWAVRVAESQPEWNAPLLIQHYALACIFYSTTTWRSRDGWVSNVDFCTWSSILCNQEGFVEVLYPVDNELSGLFPVEVFLLADSLRILDLGFNPMLTHIEAGSAGSDYYYFFLGRLTELTRLSIRDTRFFSRGGIPTYLGQLTKLEYLDCAFTSFSGLLREESIGNWQQLTHLDISENAFSFSSDPDDYADWSTIPLAVGKLPLLKYFDASYAQVTGELEFMRFMTGIETVKLVGNPGLEGTLPSFLGDLATLSTFDATFSGLRGWLPTQIGNLSNSLQSLVLESNALTGRLPEEWQSLTRLTTLNLVENGFIGSVPSSWSSMVSLRQLHLDRNSLSATLPLEVCQMQTLLTADCAICPFFDSRNCCSVCEGYDDDSSNGDGSNFGSNADDAVDDGMGNGDTNVDDFLVPESDDS